MSWLLCVRCDGTGFEAEHNGWTCDGECCPDCVSGRVPPAGMVEAAARAMHPLLYDKHPDAQVVSCDLDTARAALLAGKRWETDNE